MQSTSKDPLALYQCPVIRNMVTERHNIASRMILKGMERVVSKGSYGSNLVHMDVSNVDRLTQHDLHTRVTRGKGLSQYF
eukprot:316352-Pelagomonas_calceolata.AAC.1